MGLDLVAETLRVGAGDLDTVPIYDTYYTLGEYEYFGIFSYRRQKSRAFGSTVSVLGCSAGWSELQGFRVEAAGFGVDRSGVQIL